MVWFPEKLRGRKRTLRCFREHKSVFSSSCTKRFFPCSRKMRAFPFILWRIKCCVISDLHAPGIRWCVWLRLFAISRKRNSRRNRDFGLRPVIALRARANVPRKKTWEREREPVSPDGGARTRLAEILRKPRAGWVLRAQTRSLALALCKW